MSEFGLHPLLASAVLGAIPPNRRRELHQLASEGAASVEERARHLALATATPSAAIAAELEEAARAAELRGAPSTAAELLNPRRRGQPCKDLADDAYRRLRSGRVPSSPWRERRGRRRLSSSEVVDTAPPGPTRAEALRGHGLEQRRRLPPVAAGLEEALAQAGDETRGSTRRSCSSTCSTRRAILGDGTRASAEMHSALGQAERSGDPTLLASVLAQLFLPRLVSRTLMLTRPCWIGKC